VDLFDFIRVLFESPKSYAEIADYDKARQFFMTNRLMSINYPIQANILNHIKIPQAKAVDYWHRNMTNVYTKVPSWIFAKGQKKAAGDKTKSKKLPSKETIKIYLNRYGLTHRDLDDAVKLFGDSVYEPIYRLEKVLQQ
jgi:hypothetical protein